MRHYAIFHADLPRHADAASVIFLLRQRYAMLMPCQR